MTPVSCSRELSDSSRVIDASYRSRSDLSRLTHLTSSSSSSSLSGVTTPLDGVPPKLAPFPKLEPGLASSGSSSSSFDRHRVRSLSFSKSPLSPTHRPVKLSLGSAKATPIPAIPSASEEHCSLGAFSLTSSAEGHLRSLVTRIASPRTPSKFFDSAVPQKPLPFSKQRERASSLRTFPVPWASISDIDEEEEEAFWPRQRSAFSATHHEKSGVPSISRSPSPPKSSDDNAVPSENYSDPRTRFASLRSATAPKMEMLRKPGHVRASSYTGPSAHLRAGLSSNLRSTDAISSGSGSASASPPRTFLRPPAKEKGKAVVVSRSPPPRGSGNATQSRERAATLDPTLAAAESASRLRSKCVCVVCGKLGVDYPRCPRCGTTWCSRQCRVSDAPAGSARHSCNGKSNGRMPVGASPLRAALA